MRCQGLVKRFGAVVAVNGLDLDVRRGECFGMLGPNGAGKTTTVEILEGLTAPDAGEVEVLGERWHGDGLALRARLGVQLQETKFPEKLLVARGDGAFPQLLSARHDRARGAGRSWTCRRRPARA